MQRSDINSAAAQQRAGDPQPMRPISRKGLRPPKAQYRPTGERCYQRFEGTVVTGDNSYRDRI